MISMKQKSREGLRYKDVFTESIFSKPPLAGGESDCSGIEERSPRILESINPQTLLWSFGSLPR